MLQENGTIDILIVAADVNALATELVDVQNFTEVATRVGDLASNSDPRARVLPLRFPATLSLGLLPVFTRAMLFDAGMSLQSTVYVNILAEDGRILDLGIPRDLNSLAPNLFEEQKRESIE